MTRAAYTLDEIKGMLLAQRHAVARHYAPPRAGAYDDRGLYWTLNPGRADRSVGSFVVDLDGPRPGRWIDYASNQRGDLIDLIALSLGCSLSDAVREARSYLGLSHDSPEDVARRKAAAARSARLAAEAASKYAADRERRAKAGLALWLSGESRIASTPIEYYLRQARGIDLRQLGRQPGALRYHPDCYYKHVDRETGEVIEGRWPAMLAIVNDGQGRAVACHRTWLALDRAGRWSKAPVPKAKKVLGDYAGASIHLWRGLGPRGGKGRPLSDAPPGSHVFIAEGIEDALSCAILLPDARVIAAISLSNIGAVHLPPAITSVTLIADQDEGAEARDALDRAIAAHAKAGRTVRVWRNLLGGKDLNDALRAGINEQEAESAHQNQNFGMQRQAAG